MTEQKTFIPIEQRYGLKANEYFVLADIQPAYTAEEKNVLRGGKLLPPDVKLAAQKRTLMSTGLYSDIKTVDALDPVTGKPNPHAMTQKGFVCTKKEG